MATFTIRERIIGRDKDGKPLYQRGLEAVLFLEGGLKELSEFGAQIWRRGLDLAERDPVSFLKLLIGMETVRPKAPKAPGAPGRVVLTLNGQEFELGQGEVKLTVLMDGDKSGAGVEGEEGAGQGAGDEGGSGAR